MSQLEKEANLISAIILIKSEINVLKLGFTPSCGIASSAMLFSISAQYVAHVNLMRQNGATFTDILTMLMEPTK